MPTELSWYEPDRILMMRADGDIVLAEMQELFHKAADALDSCDHTIHVIFDARRLVKIPSTAVNRLDASARLIRHSKLGWAGMVGLNAVSNFWLRLFSKILGLKYGSFDTIEEAAVFLHELDRVKAGADDQ